MHIVAIINQKGGVGKTTTAVTLAHGLAQRGQRVLLADLDAQGNVADALGLEKSPGLHRLLIENAGHEAISPSGRPGLDLILGDKHTVEAKQILAGRPFRERVLGQALRALPGYDIALLDISPGIDILQISALIAADVYLIPAALDHLAAVGVADALASSAALGQAGVTGARLLGILPTFWERTTNESGIQLQLLVERFGSLVWPPIPQDVKAREAPAHGLTLWEYAPRARALQGVALNGSRQHVGGYIQALEQLLQEIKR